MCSVCQCMVLYVCWIVLWGCVHYVIMLCVLYHEECCDMVVYMVVMYAHNVRMWSGCVAVCGVYVWIVYH